MEYTLMNEYQTPLNEETLKGIPNEVKEQLYDIINNVEFIQRLVSPNRQRAKDRPRDNDGKIIVDLANPHIVENIDYFRPTALHFKKYGCFTLLRPNSNPTSEYGKWLREERRRCWEGYVRPTDGEWVTGYMYWYLNYCPIMLAKKTGAKTANRVEDFPEFWEGVYWRTHYLDQARKSGKHAIELARRGCGKSYTLASLMAHNFILGENAESHKRTMTVLTAYQKEYLAGKDGTLSKFVPMIDFIAEHTQFPRLRLRSSIQDMMWKMGYKDVETGAEKGTLNTVIGVSSKDDEDKLRGKRGYIFIEEMGSFPNLLSIYNTIRYGVEEGDLTFGLIYLVGTAAEDASDFSSAKELMYNTKGYNIYSIKNVFDKNSSGNSTFGFFFPSYINRKGCYNKDGVSDVTKALLEILMARYEAKYNSSDPTTILRVIAEMPITPAEAIIKVGVNTFPVPQLTERLVQLDSNPNSLDDVYVGSLEFNNQGTLEFKPTNSKSIRYFPTKDNKVEGAIEIFQMPEIDKHTNKPYANRYILGHDPVDNDTAETMSLSSTIVLDLWTDKIVAEYTGRLPYAEDNYEVCRKLCLFYNGRVNYENNKKGLFAYFSKMNCTYLLTDVLEFLKDRQMIKAIGYGNVSKGTVATAAINNYAKELIRKWLLTPMPIVSKEGDEEVETSIPNLFSIKNRALLQELISYNPDGNFDRVSSLGMLMLLREDRIITYQGNLNKESFEEVDSSYLGNDPFFTKNYNDKFKINLH
jgi:hypothetical protein